MNVDIYGHVTAAGPGSLNLRRSSVGVVYANARAKYKKEADKRFIFKSNKVFMYALMLSLTSTYQFTRFVSRVREYQGVAFYMPFTFVYVCVGLPILMSQLFIGHYAKVSIITAWRFSPLGTGVGYTMLTLALVRAIRFGRIIALHLIHIPLAMKYVIPWVDCDLFPDQVCINDASNNLTIPLQENGCCATPLNAFGNCDMEITNAIPFPSLLWHTGTQFLGSSYTLGDPIKEFKLEYVGFLVAAWLLMFILLQKDLHFYSKMLVPIANIIMCIMALFLLVVFFDGGNASMEGLKFFFNLKINALIEKDNKLWRTCFVQGLETLQVGYGTHMVFSSHAPKKTNAVTTTVALGFINYILLLVVTFLNAAIGSVVAFDLGAPSPRCIQTFDWSVLYAAPGQYFGTLANGAAWSILYFLTLATIDLVYMVLIMLSILQSIWDAWPKLWKYHTYVTLGLCTFCCLVGLPLISNAGHLMNYMLAIRIIPFISIMAITFYTLIMFWVYGVVRLSDDIHFLTGKAPSAFWTLMWYLIPCFLIAFELPAIIEKINSEIDITTYYVLLCVSLLLMFPIPILACYHCMVYFRAKNFYRVIFPAPEWGPLDPDERHRRLHFNPRKAVRYSVDAPLKWRPSGLISKRQLKFENDRLESHRKIFLEYIKMKREEAAAEAARSAQRSADEAGETGKKDL